MTNRHSCKDVDDSQTQWLTFSLGNETYSVEVLHVQVNLNGVTWTLRDRKRRTQVLMLKG